MATRYNAFVTGAEHKWPVVWALVAMALVLGWQALTVRANYGGNWTGLFRTGSATLVPENLEASTFRNHHPIGYDGQFYRFLAHDPFLLGDTWMYMDDPLLRSRRILVPLTAWMLAAGQQRAIDGAYVLVVAGFIGLGTFWLACIMAREGRHAALGLLFLMVPGALIGVDSMTVDVALAALTAGFAWYVLNGRERGMWLVVAAAALVRETGLALPAAYAASPLLQRDFRKAMWRATAVVPVAAWYGYLFGVLPPGQTQVQPWVLRFHLDLGILMRAMNPLRYPMLNASVEKIVRIVDVLSLTATMAMAAVGLVRIRRVPAEIGIALGLYVALMLAMTSPKFYDDPYTYGRCFAPIFVLVLAAAARMSWRATAVVAVLCLGADMRVAAEMQTQMAGVAHWLGIG